MADWVVREVFNVNIFGGLKRKRCLILARKIINSGNLSPRKINKNSIRNRTLIEREIICQNNVISKQLMFKSRGAGKRFIWNIRHYFSKYSKVWQMKKSIWERDKTVWQIWCKKKTKTYYAGLLYWKIRALTFCDIYSFLI